MNATYKSFQRTRSIQGMLHFSILLLLTFNVFPSPAAWPQAATAKPKIKKKPVAVTTATHAPPCDPKTEKINAAGKCEKIAVPAPVTGPATADTPQPGGTNTGAKPGASDTAKAAAVTCDRLPAEKDKDGKPVGGLSVEVASALADRLDLLEPGVSVRPIGSGHLLVCADNVNTRKAIGEEISANLGSHDSTDATPGLNETLQTRLYFNRDAKDIAALLSQYNADIKVGSIGTDLIIFQRSNPASDAKIHEMKRLIALLDSPRPQLAVDAWSLQISARTEDEADKALFNVRTTVERHNQQLQDALLRGTGYLDPIKNVANNTVAADPKLNRAALPFSPYFAGYVLKRYEDRAAVTPAGTAPVSIPWTGIEDVNMICQKGEYCLGYQRSFGDFMQPTITNIIGAAAGLTHFNRINALVDCLENRSGCPSAAAAAGEPAEDSTQNCSGGACEDAAAAASCNTEASSSRSNYAGTSRGCQSPCEKDDVDFYDHGNETAPAFACFRRVFIETMGDSKRRALLRAAMADFLYQYKFSVQYPQDFDPRRYVTSAQTLDSELEPLLVAYHRDLVEFLRHTQKDVSSASCAGGAAGKASFGESCKNDKDKPAFLSDGIVSIRTLSGTDAEVDTTTQNQFKETPPALLQDFSKQLALQEKNVPSSEQANMGAQIAAGSAALLNSSQPVNVSIGRDLNLKISSTSLEGAGAAELKIGLESMDNGKPQAVSSDGTVKDDSTNRVAKHVVNTNIRIESLKLFEVSSFSAELSRGRKPIPLLPPLVELPYIGSIVKYTPQPSTVNHRSIAIISAAILPTAADLLSGLKFDDDVIVTKAGYAARTHPAHDACENDAWLHREMLDCISWEARAEIRQDDVREAVAHRLKDLSCQKLAADLLVPKCPTAGAH